MSRSISGPLAALLNGGADFQMADLWTFTLLGGVIVRWSGAQVALAWSGNTFALGPGIDRGKIKHTRGVKTAQLEATLIYTPTDLINGAPISQFIAGAGFDGATCKLERAFLPNWASAITGTVIDFAGKVTSIQEVTRTRAVMTISSWLHLLDADYPPNVFQSSCANSLFDTGCGLSAATYQVGGATTGTPGVSAFNSNLTNANGYFDQGRITFTSGPNNGVTRMVKSYLNASGAIQLVSPLPVAPAAGNTFNVWPGCDLSMGAGGCTKFSNLIHFRGEPFVPVPETAF